MSEKVPVVFEDGHVEEIDGDTEVTFSFQEKGMPDGFRRVLWHGPLITYERSLRTLGVDGAYSELPDGRCCQVEGWKDEALRLRRRPAVKLVNADTGEIAVFDPEDGHEHRFSPMSALRNSEARAARYMSQLKLIDSISECDWESSKAAEWVFKIRRGEPLDGMVTQAEHEEGKR